jgi:phospholipid-binding lipoprotein MlaA
MPAPNTEANKNVKKMTLLSSTTRSGNRLARLLLVLASAAILAGCASVPNPSPNDPWESYNRSMYAFNTKVDDVILKPIAKGYNFVTPKPVRSCIHNMFNNVEDVWSAFNSFIQGNGVDFINTIGRVLFNTTMGIGGCFDMHSMNGGKRVVNDFGITLGVWGVHPGPYLVLPFLGPSTARDGAATATSLVATFSDNTKYFNPAAPIMAIENIPVRNSVLALNIIDARANLLDTEQLVDQVALDKYSFIRDAYLQRRRSLVRAHKAKPGSQDSLPDYNQQSLPDYSDQSLPQYDDPADADYSDVEPVSTSTVPAADKSAPAAGAAGTAARNPAN